MLQGWQSMNKIITIIFWDFSPPQGMILFPSCTNVLFYLRPPLLTVELMLQVYQRIRQSQMYYVTGLIGFNLTEMLFVLQQ